MKIAVIGTGYVGLVTGTCFSELGNHVTCVDIDERKVKKLKEGKITIYEPGLEALFLRNTTHGRLDFTTSLKEGVKGAKVIFLALPTPPGEDGSADLKYVLQVAKDIGPLLEDYTVIVNKSTVPVGTAEKVRNILAANTKVDFDVVSNPEFLREGVAVEDFMKPDRVVVGTSSMKAISIMDALYAPLVRQGNPIIFMDERSSELTKYAANSFLATKISFMNEIANLCERLGSNVDDVRKGIGFDSRIGKRFLFAGIGYGGSCFPKDVQALSMSAQGVDYEFKILNAVMDINQQQRLKMFYRIRDHFGGQLEGKTIAIWGLAFKPYTDDIREAPSIYNIEALLQAGARVRAYDPEAMENIRELFGDRIELFEDEYKALEGADALLIVTEWPVFRQPMFDIMEQKLKNKLIFDGRNLYPVDEMERMGYTYYSIGRKEIHV
jgi:UDPglucose 6-dehydrogenase